jgi:succinate dehydrogenase/fumarate reductase cytochrome b subunit
VNEFGPIAGAVFLVSFFSPLIAGIVLLIVAARKGISLRAHPSRPADVITFLVLLVSGLVLLGFGGWLVSIVHIKWFE